MNLENMDMLLLIGLRHYIRNHINLTQKILDWINADDNFEIVTPAPFNLI